MAAANVGFLATYPDSARTAQGRDQLFDVAAESRHPTVNGRSALAAAGQWPFKLASCAVINIGLLASCPISTEQHGAPH